MDRYVIGVDVGGTKSHLALFDTSGGLVDFRRWGPLNHESLPGSFAQFEDEFAQFVRRTLTANGVSMDQIAHAVLGIAGVDTKKQHRIVTEILQRLGFARFTLCNDAFLGVPAGSPTGTGICAINGTGCSLAGLNAKGEMLQLGGIGAISDDRGGGGYMGEHVVASVYRELFRKGEPTRMTALLFHALGITSKYDYVERICEKIDEGSFDVETCGWMMFEAARQNDRVAIGILRDMAENYAGGISCMMEELAFPQEDELFVVLAGSVFVKGSSPILVETLKEKLREANPCRRIQYTLLDTPTVAGAVIWALNTIGTHADRDRICLALQREPHII